VLLLTLLFVSQVLAHGHMRCIDGVFDKNRVITKCNAGIRNEAVELGTPIENYKFNRQDNLPMCQATARGVANLDKYYSADGTGGLAKMGVLEPGQQVQIIWYARTHAVAQEQPRDVAVYMSPRPIAAGQTDDFALEEMLTNKICQGPYANCGNGPFQWVPNANNISCTLDCWMPTKLPDGRDIIEGTYTILWRWFWPAPERIQHTCGDVKIVKVAGKTYTPKDLYGVTGSCSDTSYCFNVCGADNVTSCNCDTKTGWLDRVCNNDVALTGSSINLLPLFTLLIAALFFV